MSIDALIQGRSVDLGGFEVLRVLPAAARRGVGPFVFVDHIGPAAFAPGAGIDIAPHPHIGLATVTYLFEGEFMHRDSAGHAQRIAPGDVNWMTAGRGIVHSERTPPDVRAHASRVHGVQTWVALPAEHEDVAPAFEHHPAATLPQIELPGVVVRVIAGHAFGSRAPATVFSPTLYCAVTMAADAGFSVPVEHKERALYVVAGGVEIDGAPVERGQMAVLAEGIDVEVRARGPVTLMLIGGTALGPRVVWWNFVASSRERIESAKIEWARYGDSAARGRFASIEGETEFIPLPAR